MCKVLLPLLSLLLAEARVVGAHRLRLHKRETVATELSRKGFEAPGDGRKVFPLPETLRQTKTAETNYTEAALADEVTSLPGLDGNLTFRHFSGFLNITETKSIFYWFTGSQSSPENDPLVWWTNGGPGGSGLYGLLSENGPFRPVEGGKVLKLNDYSWNKVANMLFVEQPVGVGFSYWTENATVHTDAQSAQDNYLVVQTFLERFPHLRTNDLYLSGESYAGHYLPHLAKVITDNNQTSTENRINLKGFLVGNPTTDQVANVVGTMQSLWGSQLIPRDVYMRWMEQCSSREAVLALYTPPGPSDNCSALFGQIYDYVGGLNHYALSYPVCPQGDGLNMHTLSLWSAPAVASLLKNRTRTPVRTRAMNAHAALVANISDSTRAYSHEEYDACQVWSTIGYLNRKDVQYALHMQRSNVTWRLVNETVFHAWSHQDRLTPQGPLYNHLVNEGLGLRIMIYSGTDDSVCSTPGTQMWLDELKWEPVSAWTPWGVEDQVDGYVQEYRNNLTFATVHGAGHEVPTFKPAAALGLFAAFISSQM